MPHIVMAHGGGDDAPDSSNSLSTQDLPLKLAPLPTYTICELVKCIKASTKEDVAQYQHMVNNKFFSSTTNINDNRDMIVNMHNLDFSISSAIKISPCIIIFLSTIGSATAT